MGEAKRKGKIVASDGKSSETVRVKKFADGKETPTEMHRRLALAEKCKGCGQHAAIVIRTFVEIKDLYMKNPDLAGIIMARNPDGPYIPTTKMKYGSMVRVGQLFVCTRCAPEAERVAARAPDWCLVEISRGPEEKVVVSVPKAFRPQVTLT